MSLSGSGRSRRRRSLHVQPPVEKKKSRKCLHLLISCCVFFFILSACLIAALVFIGKHFYYNDVRFEVGRKLKDNEVLSHTTNKMNVTRLSRNVIPSSYELTMHPHMDAGVFAAFSGEVNITIRIVDDNATDIMLNSQFIKILSVDFFQLGMLNAEENRIDIHEFRLNEIDQTLTIYPGRDLYVDEVFKVCVRFEGILMGRVGFYRSSYFDRERNTKRSIATTKFEPTYARQAFPCFDEPNLKANFTIHIIKPKDANYIALSNMPVKSETEVEDGIKVSFVESVKMSTYLACWVVSDFKSRNDVIKSKFPDIPYRVFATPAQLEKTEYAAFVGKKVMEFYLDYFQIPFPLPKLDMLAIPDYSSGATEHWGIVTYRETSLLFDKNISSSVNQRRVATVIAHELAHSWFGNLVTMDWWNDIWLNEGFASYIEYKGVEAAHPDWKMMDQFVLDDLHNVLIMDATLATHPIVQTAVTPDEITSLFDTISYSKGASIIRMLENSIGNDAFRNGVTNYLKKYSFSNAVTQDLLDELQKLVEDSLNLTEYLNTWTVQNGFPVLNAVKTANGFRLTQKKFNTDPNVVDTTPTAYNYKWTVPVTYFTDSNSTAQLVWFNHNVPHIDVPVTGKFVKFNARQVGYYRVNYEPEQWFSLIENINALEGADKAHLIEETFRLAEASQIPYEIPLNLSRYLSEELEYIPWAVSYSMFKELLTNLLSSKVFVEYKKHVIDLVMPAVNHFSWNETEDDSHLAKLTRIKVLNLACSFDEESCLNDAKDRLKKYLYDGVKPSPDLKELVYKYGIINGNIQDWDKMWQLFVDVNDAGEKLALLSGLCASKDQSIIYKLLDLLKDDTYLRKQDYPTAIANLAGNPVGSNIVWVYFRENWPALVERFGLNDRYLHNMIPTVTARFTTKTQRDELLVFYADNPEVGSGASARKRALESVNNRINWLQRNKEGVESWFEKNKQ